MNNTIFETQRLIVRTATVDDVDLYYHLWTDPRVMAMVGFPRGMRISQWVGEDIGQFPEAMRQDTTPVHYYIYQIHRADWQKNKLLMGCKD